MRFEMIDPAAGKGKYRCKGSSSDNKSKNANGTQNNLNLIMPRNGMNEAVSNNYTSNTSQFSSTSKLNVTSMADESMLRSNAKND